MSIWPTAGRPWRARNEHWNGDNLLDSGVDLRYIQELLGHKSSKTTEIYTHVSNAELSKIRNPLLRIRAEKWQIVHHIDGVPNNNADGNLETICPMCNLIHHSGQGCVVQGIVDVYKKSTCSQNEIMLITRKMRAEGKRDDDIINYLGLKDKARFKMDKKYLKSLYGFVTSREPTDDWTQKALEYGYKTIREVNISKSQSLDKFIENASIR